jgi:hypothetical protein
LVEGNAALPSTAKHDGQAHDHAAAVRRIVAGLQPILGSSGERYLGETRGIDTGSIADILERTDAVGLHPAVYFNEPDHALHGRSLGALVAIIPIR